MGGEREEVIDDQSRKKAGGGQPRRVSGEAAAGTMVQGGGKPLPKDTGGVSVPDAHGGGTGGIASPARALLAALEEARRSVADGDAVPPGLGGQSIRCHEAKGQIHFHADDDGIKAGVPVAEVWSAWRRLQHLDKFTYLDAENGTLLTILSYLDADPVTNGDRVSLVINVRSCKPTFSKEFRQLDQVIGK